MTSERDTKQSKPRLSGAERQRRYRAKLRLCSIDISQKTASQVAKVRKRTGMSNDKVIAAALDLLLRTNEVGRRSSKRRQNVGSNDPQGRPVSSRSSPGDKSAVSQEAVQTSPVRRADTTRRTKRKRQSKTVPEQTKFEFEAVFDPEATR